MDKKNYFDWSDAWVFAALFPAITDEGTISFSKLVKAGDILNHAIFLSNEIRQGLSKLQKRGLIKIDSEKCEITELGQQISDAALKMRGGLFSIVNNYCSKMNSKKYKMPFIEEVCDVSYITEDFIKQEYEKSNSKH